MPPKRPDDPNAPDEDEDNGEAQPEEQPEHPPVKEPPSTAGLNLTRDDIAQLVRGAADAAAETTRRLLVQDRQAQGLPPVEDVTDEELENAIATGGAGSAAKIRKAIKAEADRLARGRIDPLAATGAHALRRLALRAAKSDMPYYDRFKDVIDKGVERLPAEQAGDPDVIVGIHDYLVGQNWKTIQAEDKQRWEQERNAPKPTQTSGGRGPNLRAVPGRSGKKTLDQLTPEDVFAPEELEALQDLGRNKNGKPSGYDFATFCRNVLGREPEEYLKEVARDRGMGETGS